MRSFRRCIFLVVVMVIASTSHVFAGRSTAPFLWRTPIGLDDIEAITSTPRVVNRIEIAKDGGTYIVGSKLNQYLTYSESAPAVVKTDAAGNVVWNRTYPVNATSRLRGMRLVEKDDGGAILLALEDSFNAIGKALVLITVDAVGSEIGRSTIKAAPGYSGSGSAGIEKVLPSPDGNFITIGWFRSADRTVYENYAAMIDQAGNLIWQVDLGQYSSKMYGVLLDDGAVAAWRARPYPLGEFVHDLDIVDSNGIVVRSEQVQATYNMAPTPDGGYFFFREMLEIDESLPFPDRFTKQVVVRHVSSAGTVDWSHTFTFPGQHGGENGFSQFEVMPDGSALYKGGGGSLPGGGGTMFSVIRIAADRSASWSGEFADYDYGAPIHPARTAVQWAPGGGFLLSGIMSYEDEFIGLLPATPQSGAVSVTIDIQPGEVTNSISLKRDSLLAVAILSRPDFDAREIDLTALTVAGAPVSAKKSGYATRVHDFNRDDLADLLVYVPIDRLSVSFGANRVKLQGALKNGVVIAGEDDLTVW